MTTMRAISLMRTNRNGRRARKALCVETEERLTISEWAERFASARGITEKTVENQLYAAIKKRGTMYGLSFKWVA